MQLALLKDWRLPQKSLTTREPESIPPLKKMPLSQLTASEPRTSTLQQDISLVSVAVSCITASDNTSLTYRCLQ